MLQRYNFLPIRESFFTYLRKSRIFAIGFERGLLKCYSFDNEKTVFIKYYVPDGTIDAGTKT